MTIQAISYALSTTAATSTASPIYGAVVAISIAPTTAAKPARNIPPIAVVAQRRAPATGDIGARPILGIYFHWCLN